ncbi:aspartate--ammonia ligase [Anaeramoeba flamelloides]|uniref:Aspartate--ammonia ligase n=1 Tax=Anaeramoeba flamelloides TaxID=1746091 RepID=A0AAV7Z0G4_9EUKA|nr:aspartate--ammonia ligase [Anaeramoeba flamelloides]
MKTQMKTIQQTTKKMEEKEKIGKLKGLLIPEKYKPLLELAKTELAILKIKEFFQTNLSFELNLTRVSAPLIVKSGTGINDQLNGIEKPVSFKIKAMNDTKVEIVQSLAKWKRMRLADYQFKTGQGIYTDMNAIRPDEELDNIHSLYVDQWDWERVISIGDRNLKFLKSIVETIYSTIVRTEKYVSFLYSQIKPILPDKIHFIHTEELEKLYPKLTPKEREYQITKKYGAVFVIGIGADLKNGSPHDGRSPDYDDWSSINNEKGYKGLNGDILVYYPILDIALELSSMGIRVDPNSLKAQLEIRACTERKDLLFHKKLLNGKLPLSIGGGIGQSRLCMFFLRKAHIGEIQTSIWPLEMRKQCKKLNIFLL